MLLSLVHTGHLYTARYNLLIRDKLYYHDFKTNYPVEKSKVMSIATLVIKLMR